LKKPLHAMASRSPTDRVGEETAGMSLPEEHTQSFVVKIWVEESAEESGQTRWRGRIMHVPSQRSRSFEKLSAILEFIKPFLQRMPGILHVD
jgi:hypothetical protein